MIGIGFSWRCSCAFQLNAWGLLQHKFLVLDKVLISLFEEAPSVELRWACSQSSNGCQFCARVVRALQDHRRRWPMTRTVPRRRRSLPPSSYRPAPSEFRPPSLPQRPCFALKRMPPGRTKVVRSRAREAHALGPGRARLLAWFCILPAAAFPLYSRVLDQQPAPARLCALRPLAFCCFYFAMRSELGVLGHFLSFFWFHAACCRQFSYAGPAHADIRRVRQGNAKRERAKSASRKARAKPATHSWCLFQSHACASSNFGYTCARKCALFGL